MENYGVGGTQVPFGDGTHVPVGVDENLLPDDIETPEHYMHNVMKNIFLTCDTGNTNYVPVSKLIEFISPFMQDHVTELKELQKALDPDQIDVDVDSETFFKEMTIWASRIGELSFDNVMEDKFTDSEIGQMDVKTNMQSTINASFGQNLLKGYLELGVHNVSNVSGSFCFDVSSHMDPVALQEQIRELDHQNRKLTDELENVRTLLTNSDDQIYNLQGEVDRICKKLTAEQHLNDQLQKNSKFNEELAESSAVAKKEIIKLQKVLATSNKELNKLAQNIEALEEQKQHLEVKLEQQRECDAETKALVMELQSDLNYKDQVIASLEESSVQFKLKLEEQQQRLAHFTDVNEQLKLEKSKLEKNFRETLTRNTLCNQIKSHSSSSYSEKLLDTGIFKHLKFQHPRRFSVDSAHINTKLIDTGIFKQSKFQNPRRFSVDSTHINTTSNSLKSSPSSFNSPTLLKMLQNPISPNISLSDQKQKLADIDDNPFRMLTVANTSTPDKKHLKPLCNNIQCSPNEQRIFTNHQFLDCDTESVNTFKLMEYSRIGVDIIDSNLNIINSNNSPAMNLYNSSRTTSDLNNLEKNSFPNVPDIVSDKSVVCSNTSNETSSEDETFWKLQMIQHSPRESLESEISQVSDIDVDGFGNNASLIRKHYKDLIKKLQKKLAEYEIITQQLADEISYLKQQISEESHSEGTNCELPEDHPSQIKIVNLESDNHGKYVQIVELMKKTEVLQKSLKKCSTKHSDEISMYKTNLTELQYERNQLKQQVEEMVRDKKEYESSKNFVSKTAVEEYKKQLDQSLQNEQKFKEKNCRLLAENSVLKNEITSLTAVLCQLNREGSDVNKCITENGTRLSNQSVLARTPSSESKKKHKGASQNTETILNGQQKNTNDAESTYLNDANSLNNVEENTNHYKARLDTLINEISELNAANTEVSRSLNERNLQISALKDLVNLQNTKMVSLECEKSNALDKLYKSKSTNDHYADENHQLKKKLLKWEKESASLRSTNSSTKGQLENLNEQYLQVKEAYDAILGNHEELLNAKEALQKSNEELISKDKKLKEKIDQLEEKITFAEQEKQKLLMETTKFPYIVDEMLSGKSEIVKLESTFNSYKCDMEKLHLEEVTTLNSRISNSESLDNTLKFNTDMRLNDVGSDKLPTEVSGILVSDTNGQFKVAKVLPEDTEGDLLRPKFTNNSICPTCHGLKIEINDLLSDNKNLERKVVSLELEVSKRKNFERLLTRIDKLKQRVEELEINNDKFQNEIQENLKNHTYEKSIIINEKRALEQKLVKYSNEEQKLREIELELKMHTDEKENIIKKNSVLEEKIRILQREKQRMKDVEERSFKTFKDLKKMQNEKMELEQDRIRDKARVKELEQALSNTQLTVKRFIREKNIAMKEKVNTDAKLSKLYGDIAKLENEKKELTLDKTQIIINNTHVEKKLADNSIAQEYHLESIVEENSQLLKQAQTLLSSRSELEKKVERLQADLRKSKATNLSIEKQLPDLQSSNCDKELNCQKLPPVIYQNELENCHKELSETKIQLTKSNNRLDALHKHMKVAKEHLSEKRQRLARSTLTLINCWRSAFESDTKNEILLDEFEKGEPVNKKQLQIRGPLDEELNKFQHQVHLTTLLLDTLINLDLSLELTSSPPTISQKQPKSQDHQTQSVTPRRNAQLRIYFQDTPCDRSPPPKNEEDITCCTDVSLGALNEDSNFQHFADVPVVWPSITDAVLESLDLLHDSDSPKWTEDELEKKFVLLAAHFTVDIKSIQGRYKQQHEYHVNLEKYFESISSKLVNNLKYINDTVKPKKLKDQSSLSCQYVELIIKLCSKMAISAVQCGALKHEQSLLKCVTIMINHSAHLNKKVDALTQQLKSFSSSTSRRGNSLFYKMSDNENTQSYILASKSALNEKNLVLHKTSSMSIIPWLRTFLILFIVFIFILCCIIVEVHHNSEHSVFNYPWDWISLEEILSPFIRRSYPHGPPPT